MIELFSALTLILQQGEPPQAAPEPAPQEEEAFDASLVPS